MMRDFKKARDRMNDLLKSIDNTSENLFKIGESIVNSIKSTLVSEGHGPRKGTSYAWTPMITAGCPSELGTTSDQCSSSCGVGSCSSRRPGAEEPDVRPIPVAQVMGDPSMGTLAWSFQGGNPF